jgi:hypothetical protein
MITLMSKGDKLMGVGMVSSILRNVDVLVQLN